MKIIKNMLSVENMIANDSFRYIALYMNCSLCYVAKMKGEWLPRTKNTLTTMPQEIRNHKRTKTKNFHCYASLAIFFIIPVLFCFVFEHESIYNTRVLAEFHF